MRCKNLPGLPVLTLDSGVRVGRVRHPVIDPPSRRVAALMISPRGSWGKRLLPIEAVHAFGGHAVTIGSADVLQPIKGAGALAPLLKDRRVMLLGSPVVSAKGELIGAVRDFEIGEDGSVTSLYVTRGVWHAVSGREIIVPGAMLLALGKDAAVVTDEVLPQVSPQRVQKPEETGPSPSSDSPYWATSAKAIRDGLASLIRTKAAKDNRPPSRSDPQEAEKPPTSGDS